MKVCTTIADTQKTLRGCNQPVGAILTMGALHEGHLTLVRQARQECSTVVVSIYVNPTQFGDQADLVTYPRNIQKDIRLLEDEAVALVVTPVDS